MFNKKKEPTNHVSIPDLNMAAKVEDRPMMAMNLRNRLDELQEENEALKKHRNKLIEENDSLYKEINSLNNKDIKLEELKPLVLERGRRIFESLKDAKPRTILVPIDLDISDHAQVLKPTPGGQLVKAYVVDNLLDLQCLEVAMGPNYLHLTIQKHPQVIINGLPVVVSGEKKEEKI